MRVEVKVENVYPEVGEHFVHTREADVPAPQAGEDMEDWGNAHILALTGEGGEYASLHASYEAKIITCDDRPNLVGEEWGAEG